MRILKSGQIDFLKQTPFLRLLIPLIAGIVTENNFPVQHGFLLTVFFISLLLFLFFNAISVSKFFGLEWIPGLAVGIALFSFGGIVILIHQDIPVERSGCFVKNQPNYLLIRLLSDPAPKQSTFKSVARVEWLIKDQNCYHENEKILIYFSNKLDARQYSGGKWIIIKKELQPIENRGFFDFDYKKYCAQRQIYSQVFLRENELAFVAGEEDRSVFPFLDTIRKKLLRIIKKEIPGKKEGSLMEALMVGFTDDLDPALLKSYADTGVIHIIAISGLHLALICHILGWALNKTGQKKSAKWIKWFLIICSLWGYSLLSGASPSAIRAAVMFSLILLARNITREASLYNTLAASAFLLICFDPAWLRDTGFQLSYGAVLSLGLFANAIRELLPLQNKILTALWKAGSVSIAAQILTTPVSIYYFHRFPTYFLLANLLAVPLSSIILLGGIGLCIFSWIPAFAHLLGWILGLLIQVLNSYINHISQLPGAVISGLTLTLPVLTEVYFLLFCFYRLVMKKEKSWLIAGLIAVCLFQVWHLIF